MAQPVPYVTLRYLSVRTDPATIHGDFVAVTDWVKMAGVWNVAVPDDRTATDNPATPTPPAGS